jgi:hypothetical protein
MDQMKLSHPHNHQLVIQNIESYYNYFNKENDSAIYSSILSNNKIGIRFDRLQGSF